MLQQLKMFLALFITAVVVSILAVIIFTDITGLHHFVSELHGAVREVAETSWNGIKILFFVFLALGVFEVHVRLKKKHRQAGVVYGDVKAIIQSDGKVIQLNNPMTMDASQQMQYTKQILQMAQLMGRTAKQLNSEPDTSDEDTVDADTPKRLPAPLPTFVRYEDIVSKIPQDHALVGIDGSGIITRERAIKALLWIVGASGTGKTNTVCLRIHEDYEWGHDFILIDPHWFKDDSLYNAIKDTPYITRLLRPLAYETEDILDRLNFFLNEFKRRKAGGSWEHPITIIIDEVGSLVSDKPETKEEEEMIAKIKQISRICGQESRGFEMTGVFISQDAAGLAWLRKRSILVIAHQLMMMSERLLACNDNAEIARAMDTWPIGRTVVYGIGLKEGQRVVQQPALKARVVESDVPAFHSARTQTIDDVPTKTSTAQGRPALRLVEAGTEVDVEAALKRGEEGKPQTALSEREKKICELFFERKLNQSAIIKEIAGSNVKGGDAYQKMAGEVAEAIRKYVELQRGA
jgi:hypothetical protein